MRFRKTNYPLWRFFLISAFFVQIFTSINFKEVRSESKLDNQIKNVINNSQNIQSSYLIGPGDVLNIFFNGIDIFSGQYTVDSEGNVYLPEVNKFNVLGLTFIELENKLLENFKPFINKPSISVSLFKARNISIFISGEINSPGLYRLTYKDEVEISNRVNSAKTIFPNASKVPLYKECRGVACSPRLTCNSRRVFTSQTGWDASETSAPAQLAEQRFNAKLLLASTFGAVLATVPLSSVLRSGEAPPGGGNGG